jgi:hypothetical protein
MCAIAPSDERTLCYTFRSAPAPQKGSRYASFFLSRSNKLHKENRSQPVIWPVRKNDLGHLFRGEGLPEIGLRNGLPFIAWVDPTAAVPVGLGLTGGLAPAGLWRSFLGRARMSRASKGHDRYAFVFV